MQAQCQLLAHRSSLSAPLENSWCVPAVEIDKLLKLSLDLHLFSEVTPVQAWQHIKSHPNFIHCDQEKLQSLQLRLLDEVQCHG